jgi:transposase
MDTMTDTPCYVGCDVSLDTLDLCIFSSGQAVAMRIANSPRAIADLIEELATRSGVLVILEASGGYEAALLEALWQADIPVARVDPRRVRRFAEAHGEKAKTDRVDARVLAEFGARMSPERRRIRAKACSTSGPC